MHTLFICCRPDVVVMLAQWLVGLHVVRRALVAPFSRAMHHAHVRHGAYAQQDLSAAITLTEIAPIRNAQGIHVIKCDGSRLFATPGGDVRGGVDGGVGRGVVVGVVQGSESGMCN